MANTLTTMQAKIFADSALLSFNSILLPLSAIASKHEAKAGQKGDSITVPLFPVATAAAFAGTYAGDDHTIVGKTITLDQQPVSKAYFTDREFAESSADYFAGMGAQQGRAVAKFVILYVMGLIKAADFGNAAGDKHVRTAATFTTADVIEIRKKLVAKGIDAASASLVLGDSYSSLLNDTVLSSAMYGGAEAVRTGKIPSLFGFNGVYESAIIPANAENLIGFGCAKQAIAFGSRYLQPISMSGVEDAGMATDEATGITLGFRMIHEPLAGKMHIATEALFGAAVADGAALVRHLSA